MRHLFRPKTKRLIHARARKAVAWQHNGTWTINGVNLRNAPTLGSEIMTNGDMETGSPPSNWTLQSGATLSSVADESTGGSGTKSINVLRGSNDTACIQAPTLVASTWYSFDGWVRNVDAASARYQLNMTGSLLATFSSVVGTTWTEQTANFLITSTGGNIRLSVATSGNGRFDRCSMKPITLNTLFAVRTGVSLPLSVAAMGTIILNTIAGVVYGLDSISAPTNCIAAVHNGGTGIVLLKMVAGVWSAVLTTTATYVAGVLPQVKWVSANTFGLWYNGVQRGANQTISDAGTGLLHGVMSTSSLNNIYGCFVS